MTRSTVLFVCVKNGGKSQMAAALMEQVAGAAITVRSAGTAAGTAINGLSAAVLLEVGIDITGRRPVGLTAAMIEAADLVVVLGTDARVEPSATTPVEVWETDEPSSRGIDGIERMRLVRDDIAMRTADLADRLGVAPA